MTAAQTAILILGIGATANAAAVVLACRRQRYRWATLSGFCCALCLALLAVGLALQ